MTTDPIAAAIDHIRSITPADGPWTPAEFATPGHDPTPTDRAIATILNAVVSGQLINRASRDKMLAQVRRGEGFATAGAEACWIADTEAGVYDTDAPDPLAAARALIAAQPDLLFRCDLCPDESNCHPHHDMSMSGEYILCDQCEDFWNPKGVPNPLTLIATLADALEAERAKVAAAYEAAGGICKRRYRDYEQMVANAERSGPSHPKYICDSTFHHWSGKSSAYSEMATDIRALTPADAQAALDKLLAAARLEGWRAGRDAAAIAARGEGEGEWFNPVQAIRALPEPKEASHG